ncbi:MAG TPA: pyridoxal-phosphate dependent enzyme [Chthoniobacterales bacterium]|nr:pyridoxal-phosphate dependent enzyme [Chthoniobacterales bacterium]HXY60977.1 pyridoxal-phosphate dependent enzyme [Chthoniobacterales bacterium]
MIEVPAAPATGSKKPPAILSMIGETPLVEVTQFDTGPCKLFLKLENQNPTGSIKDRIALSMVEAAERDGFLQPGGTVVEATAGNTGLGLALVAAAKGYRLVLVIPDKMSQEKISHVRALGAEVHLARSDVTRGHPEYYQDVAARLAGEISGGFYVNQFGNPANPLAHERTTGPEIWEQMRHDVDAIVVGVGSGGTLTGLGRFFNRVKPRRGIEMVLADPTGSILFEYVKTGKLVESGSWAVEGIGEDFVPEIADMSLVTEAYEIDDEESFATARDLLRREGIFGGSSTGTLFAGALRYCREQKQPKRVVSLVPDTGNKYLSKMYNDFWMTEQGFIHRAPHGDLSDLISHRYEAGEVITVGPDDTLLTAFKRMRGADVSQLPVVDQNRRAIGILDESDVLVKVHRDSTRFNDQVKSAMTDRLETLPPNANINDLLEVFDRGRVAIVMEDDKFLGLITRTDLLSYLRLHMPKSSVPTSREYS